MNAQISKTINHLRFIANGRLNLTKLELVQYAMHDLEEPETSDMLPEEYYIYQPVKKNPKNSHEMFGIPKSTGLSQDDLCSLQRSYLEAIWGDVK